MRLAIYETGSSVFLKNSRDLDVMWYYSTQEEVDKARKQYRRSPELDVHIRVAKPQVFLGCYIYPFMKLLEGQDLHLDTFSIFDESIKSEYVRVLQDYAKRLRKESKLWYHILTACYLYDNNSYELTKEQLENIQNVHDSGISDELKDYCCKTLNMLI